MVVFVASWDTISASASSPCRSNLACRTPRIVAETKNSAPIPGKINTSGATQNGTVDRRAP